MGTIMRVAAVVIPLVVVLTLFGDNITSFLETRTDTLDDQKAEYDKKELK